MDILFKTEDYVFSYRVAGICVQRGKVLLQKPVGGTDYAFPGGHVTFGETNTETLKREFQEELGAEVSIGELKWVGEVFFPWGQKPCHQICLYYMVDLCGNDIPTDGSFTGTEQMEDHSFKLEFHWVPLEQTGSIDLYPTNTKELLQKPMEGTQHFIYRE